MKPYHQEAGFTLVELIVVLAIVAVLAGSVIPIAGIYKERAWVAQGLQAAHCLQISIATLGFLSVEERTAVIQKMGGSSAEFFETSESLGCRLGPTSAMPRAPVLLDVDACKVRICVDGQVVQEEGCSSYDESHLALGEVSCGMYMICRLPSVPGKQIEVSDGAIEVRTR